MKSLKLVLVAAIVSIAMIGYAKDAKKPTAKKAPVKKIILTRTFIILQKF